MVIPSRLHPCPRCGRVAPSHDRTKEIIGRDSGSRDHAVVHGLQQRQSLLLGAAGDKGDFKYDQVIGVLESEERRRVEESAARQNMNDLEEIFRRNA
jgi:hypothetical protein